ncbi:MAG: tol-pal system protein YbgF [Nitrospira sp. CR1.2]|nr:tol-pal system protein YbgF [Nitrospira sp. CR1.2]
MRPIPSRPEPSNFTVDFCRSSHWCGSFIVGRQNAQTELPPFTTETRGNLITMARFTADSVRGVAAALLLFSTLHTTPALYAATPQPPDAAHRLYDRVMEEFRHKDYAAALAGFRFFLELHGQSSLSANAQYWMGECQYRMGRHNDALTSFFKLISDYPMSQKLAASTLKIGQIYTKQGDRDKAQMMYERVTGQYPDSPEAEVARKALEAEAAKGDPVAAELN